MAAMAGERLAALKDITLELAKGETPCGKCMGPGCDECRDTGADLASLKTIREHFAQALEVVARAQGRAIVRLAQELRTTEGDRVRRLNIKQALPVGTKRYCSNDCPWIDHPLHGEKFYCRLFGSSVSWDPKRYFNGNQRLEECKKAESP